MNTYKEVIDILGLEPLIPEGGMWVKSCQSEEMVPDGTIKGYSKDRPLFGAIYYLLTPNTCSSMHRLVTNEIWLHHSGPAVKLLLIYPDGRSEVRLLGQDLKRGERPQILVPKGVWQGATIDSESCERYGADKENDEIFTFISTTMTPEYQESDYVAGTFDDLKQYVAEENLELLRVLTGEEAFG